MALLKATRQAQYPLSAEFTFAVTDTATNTSGATGNLNAAGAFDVINLPVGAVVVGGEVVVNTASNEGGAASTIAVGDSASASRYLSATTIKSTGRTALVPTGYNGLGENLRITLAATNGDATAGNVTVRVQFIILGRGNEAITS